MTAFLFWSVVRWKGFVELGLDKNWIIAEQGFAGFKTLNIILIGYIYGGPFFQTSS